MCVIMSFQKMFAIGRSMETLPDDLQQYVYELTDVEELRGGNTNRLAYDQHLARHLDAGERFEVVGDYDVCTATTGSEVDDDPQPTRDLAETWMDREPEQVQHWTEIMDLRETIKLLAHMPPKYTFHIVTANSIGMHILHYLTTLRDLMTYLIDNTTTWWLPFLASTVSPECWDSVDFLFMTISILPSIALILFSKRVRSMPFIYTVMLKDGCLGLNTNVLRFATFDLRDNATFMQDFILTWKRLEENELLEPEYLVRHIVSPRLADDVDFCISCILHDFWHFWDTCTHKKAILGNLDVMRTVLSTQTHNLFPRLLATLRASLSLARIASGFNPEEVYLSCSDEIREMVGWDLCVNTTVIEDCISVIRPSQALMMRRLKYWPHALYRFAPYMTEDDIHTVLVKSPTAFVNLSCEHRDNRSLLQTTVDAVMTLVHQKQSYVPLLVNDLHAICDSVSKPNVCEKHRGHVLRRVQYKRRTDALLQTEWSDNEALHILWNVSKHIQGVSSRSFFMRNVVRPLLHRAPHLTYHAITRSLMRCMHRFDLATYRL